MKYQTIYLDMDGVLCNFHLEAIRAHMREGKAFPALDHFDTPLQLTAEKLHSQWLKHAPGLTLQKWLMPKKERETDDDWMHRFWLPIRRASFVWENLEPYEWFREVIEVCREYGEHLEIVTSPDYHNPACHYGKVRWLTRFKLDIPIWQNSRKAALSRPGTLLIDDYAKQCEKFASPQCGYNGTLLEGSHPDMGCHPGSTYATTKEFYHHCHGDAILFPGPWNALHAHSRNPIFYLVKELTRLTK